MAAGKAQNSLLEDACHEYFRWSVFRGCFFLFLQLVGYYDPEGKLLLQHARSHLDNRFGMETVLHYRTVYEIVYGYNAHAQMMRHVSLHNLLGSFAAGALFCVVGRFVKTVWALKPFRFKHLQI